MELVVGQFLLRAVFFSLLIFLDMAGISLAYGERKKHTPYETLGEIAAFQGLGRCGICSIELKSLTWS